MYIVYGKIGKEKGLTAYIIISNKSFCWEVYVYKIILNDKLESYDEARLNRELLVLLHKFYSNKLLTLSYDNSMNFKEKVNQIRKVKDNLYQLKQGKLVSYNLWLKESLIKS